MLRFGTFSLISCALIGCASGGGGLADCARSLCGCDKPYTRTVVFQLANKDSSPVSGATLICFDNYESFGTTNHEGVLRVRVQGRTSPGCGFHADCKTAFFQTEEHGWERPFWLHRAVRGEEIDAVERSIKVSVERE